MLPLFANELGATETEIGFISSSYFIARLFMELPIGIISDRIGRRKPIVLGLLLSAVSAVICGMSSNVYQLIAGRALWGVGGALYFASSTVLVLDLFKEGKGKALGLFQGIEFGGRLVGSPLGGALTEYLGFRAAFFSTGAVLVVGFVIGLLSKDFKDSNHGTVKENPKILASFLLLRNGPVAIASLVGFLRTFNLQGITQTLIPIFQAQDLGFSPLIIGSLGIFRTAGQISMALLGGYLLDRIGKKTVLQGGIILSAIANVGHLLFPTIEGHAFMGALSGVGSGLLTVTLPIVVTEAVDDSVRGSAMGAYRTVFDSGSSIGPIAVTMMSENFSIQLSLYVSTALLLFGMPLIQTLRYPRSKKGEEKVS